MKILYMSCHSVLEFDEVSLLHELGHEVFSPGAYVEPKNPGDTTLRPGISGLTYNPDVVARWHELAAKHPGQDTKDYLTKEFVSYFDVVVVMHLPRWISNNWVALQDKRVIWRTIGQSITSTERELLPYRGHGLEVVRYSPMERNIPGFIGEDALIRFYKDPNEYKGWTGETPRVVSIAQHMQQRNQACNFDLFDKTTRIFPRLLYGPGSESLSWGKGKVPYSELQEALRTNRVYFYTGTHPASYTLNFIEAFMTGTPIVAIGPQAGNASYFHNHNLYEIPYLLQNHYSGFWSDDIRELRIYISQLLGNQDLATLISLQAREQAIKIFGKETIKNQWQKYLE